MRKLTLAPLATHDGSPHSVFMDGAYSPGTNVAWLANRLGRGKGKADDRLRLPAMSCGDSTYPVRTQDWQGKWCRWAARSYDSHVLRRPYVADLHAAIGTALRDPDQVGQLAGGGWDYYRDGVLSGSYTKCRLLVYVEWDSDVGEIRTAFAVRERFRTDYERWVYMRGVRVR